MELYNIKLIITMHIYMHFHSNHATFIIVILLTITYMTYVKRDQSALCIFNRKINVVLRFATVSLAEHDDCPYTLLARMLYVPSSVN